MSFTMISYPNKTRWLNQSGISLINTLLVVQTSGTTSDESLKKIKAYGFTKYQQKLFKDTNYLFLDNFKSKVNRFKEDLIGFNKSYAHNPSEIYQHELKQRFGLNLNVYIWGHSLDISDKDYILDLFSLNDDIDRNVRVTVYYFDKTAKFSLLNNLLAILDKAKVEN